MRYKRPFFVKEEISGTLLLVGIEFDPIDSLAKNKIWKISTNGDTSSFHIDFGSVQSSFNYIERLSGSTYLIIGSSSDSADIYSSNLLNILWTDSSFNLLSIKTYPFENFKDIILNDILKDDFGYYVLGQISQQNIPNRYYPIFIRINDDGDTVRTSIYNTFYGLQPIFNALRNKRGNLASLISTDD